MERRVHRSRAGWLFDVIRAMVDAGQPDGPAAFHDERGMACLTVASIHSCARRYRPTDADRAAREAREKAKGYQGGALDPQPAVARS